MFNNSVTRWQNGFTNARESETFSDLPVPDYGKLHDYTEDFDYYIGPVAAGTTNGYTLTGTGSSVAMAAADGGVVNLIGATTGFIAALQRSQGSFLMQEGYPAWYEIIAALSTLGSSTQMIAGLTNVTGTPFTGGQITDGIWFSSDTAGQGALSINYAYGGTVVSSALGVNLVAAQYATLKWYYDAAIYAAAPLGRIVWEASGAGVSANARGEVVPASAFPGATLLAPQWAVKGTAGTPTLAIDYTAAIKMRINPNATPTF